MAVWCPEPSNVKSSNEARVFISQEHYADMSYMQKPNARSRHRRDYFMFRQTCTAQRDRRVCVCVEGVHQELRTVGRRSVILNAAPTAALCYIAPQQHCTRPKEIEALAHEPTLLAPLLRTRSGKSQGFSTQKKKSSSSESLDRLIVQSEIYCPNKGRDPGNQFYQILLELWITLPKHLS